jgi:hypothetical protein
VERDSTVSINVAKALLALLFGVAVWRAATLPFTAAEAVAWDRCVRPRFGELLVTPGAWSGFLYGLVARRFTGLFRLSEVSLRLPAVLSCVLYFWAVYGLCRRRLGDGWLFFAAILPLVPAPVFMDCFSFSGGVGLSLALCAVAASRPRAAGLCLGLAVAAWPQYGIVPATVAAGLMLGYGFWLGMERIIVPAVVTAFVLLILPLSHGGPALPQPRAADPADSAMQSAIGTLRARAGKTPVRISVSPSAEPLVEFYRARYRERQWAIGRSDGQYHLWMERDGVPATERALAVVFRRNGVVLAR